MQQSVSPSVQAFHMLPKALKERPLKGLILGGKASGFLQKASLFPEGLEGLKEKAVLAIQFCTLKAISFRPPNTQNLACIFPCSYVHGWTNTACLARLASCKISANPGGRGCMPLHDGCKRTARPVAMDGLCHYRC